MKKMSSIDDKLRVKLKEFEHTFNPEHFYCRLREIGISKEYATRFTIIYKHGIYDEVIDYVKEKQETEYT